jgi:DNA-binding CsgD family transcriptional regulator
MASNPDFTNQRPVRLGRSAVTGQFVLKPVGKPSIVKRASPKEGADFSVNERMMLYLAAKRLSSERIAQKLDVPISTVNSTLDRAKRRYATRTRLDAARSFIRAKKSGGAVD